MLVQFQILGFMYPVYDSQVTRPYSSHSALQLQKYLHMYKLYMLFVLILSLLFKTTSTYKSVALILSLLSRITSTWLTSCLCATPNYKSLALILTLLSQITSPWFSSNFFFPKFQSLVLILPLTIKIAVQLLGSHPVSPIQITSTVLGYHPLSPIQN